MIEVISESEAFAKLSASDQIARYPNFGRGRERLFPRPSIAHKPRFRIDQNSRIFAIGSCFAIGVEKALVKLGTNVLSYSRSLEAAVRIKYTTKCILQDLSEAFDRDHWFDSVYYVNGGCQTLNFSSGFAKMVMPESKCRLLAEMYYLNLQNIQYADVVIITLGLAENWYDREKKRYANVVPPRNLRREYRGRFEVHVFSYEEILEDLRKIVGLIGDFSHANVLITVSPVPMTFTFRDQDCIQANMYSKCVQRAAIEKLCAENQRVSYFPSYETVILADAEQAWGPNDFRHVNQEMISHIMRQLLSAYMPEGDAM